MCRFSIALCFLFSVKLNALFFLNPQQPSLQTRGVFDSPRDWYCLRIGYVVDSLYSQDFHPEFVEEISACEKNRLSLMTNGALVTLNIKNWLDFNVLIASSQLELIRETFTKRQFSWAAGTKFQIYQTDRFCIAFDAKYFESKQRPVYFLGEGRAFEVVNQLIYYYWEAQASLGASFRSGCFFPYLHGTYVYSKIDPTPSMIELKYPQSKAVCEIKARSMEAFRRWGIALGATLLAGTQGSITFETRLFNQNALTISGEVRF